MILSDRTILKMLEEKKLIRRITGDGLSDRYDSSYVPHGHLLCEICGKVWDFSIEGIDDLIKKEIKKSFTSYELKVRHICPKCKVKSDLV